MRHQGQRALVTGGGKGIGAAIARHLASEGASVAMTYHTNRAAAQDLAVDLERKGFRTSAFHADIGEPAQIRTLVDMVADEFAAIDVVASNAGVEHHGALRSITPEAFDQVFRVNVAGQFFLTQGAAAVMPPGGRVVLTSSISARVASYHHALYACSKAAVSSLVLSLAPELAEAGIGMASTLSLPDRPIPTWAGNTRTPTPIPRYARCLRPIWPQRRTPWVDRRNLARSPPRSRFSCPRMQHTSPERRSRSRADGISAKTSHSQKEVDGLRYR
jgi:NAD(P)-dependent dehydrogenase (short-subunit alcohol dehydrogenase family)